MKPIDGVNDADLFSIQEHIHNLTTARYWVEIRSRHLKGSPHWSLVHAAIKRAGANLVFGLSKIKERTIIPGSAARVELELELRHSFPYKRFTLTEHVHEEPQWFRYTVHLQGNIIAICEFALRATNLKESDYHVTRSKRETTATELHSESEDGSGLGAGEESDPEFESDGASEIESDGPHYADVE